MVFFICSYLYYKKGLLTARGLVVRFVTGPTLVTVLKWLYPVYIFRILIIIV